MPSFRFRSGLRAAALATLAGLVLVLTAPWGDYPLNDDWTFARIARRFAETGRFVADVPVAPSVVAQSLAAAPVIRMLGFSHTSLRLLTFAAALSCLWSVGRLLLLAGLPWRARFFAQALLLLNPLFLNVSLSFMTEVYGLAPALLGAVVWFSERKRAITRAEGEAPLLRPWVAVIAALLVALGFWSRQHSAVVYPALVGSVLLPRLLRGAGRGSGRLALGLVPGILLFGALIAFYPTWAQATGNIRAEFSGPRGALLTWNPEAWLYGLSALPFYQTAFLLPLLLLVPWRGLRWSRVVLVAGSLLAFAGLGAWSFWDLSAPEFTTFVYQHRLFPFLPNVVFNAGVGAVTLPEVFFDGLPPAQLSRALWISVEVLLGFACVLWTPVLLRLRLSDPAASSLRSEISAFGVLWAAGTTALVLQAHQIQLFDRYLLPVTIGLLLAVAALANRATPPRLVASLALFVPLAWFTLAGTHDYFRWNDARWAAVRSLVAGGISPTVIQGGYEVNGWLVFDDYVARREPVGCIGPCGCSVLAQNWNCLDDSYRIAMHAIPGYDTIATRPVRAWLADCPPILTLRRVRR